MAAAYSDGFAAGNAIRGLSDTCVIFRENASGKAKDLSAEQRQLAQNNIECSKQY
jgi:hypothetical protein